jgi:chromosome partitioning protein
MGKRQDCKIIAVMNEKGGVGKTFLCMLLGQWFSLVRGFNCLIVDLDMQANSSDRWLEEGMIYKENAVGGKIPPIHPDYADAENKEDMCERSTVADIFDNKIVLPYATWIHEGIGSKGGMVDILLSHPEKLENVNIEIGNESRKVQERMHKYLPSLLKSEGVREAYDIIILDTGPSRSPIFRSALKTADYVIVPFSPGKDDIAGLNAMKYNIKQENFSRKRDDKLVSLGFAPNRTEMHTSLHKENMEELYSQIPDELTPKDAWIPRSTNVGKNEMDGAKPKSLFDLARKEKIRNPLIALCEHVERKMYGKLIGRKFK